MHCKFINYNLLCGSLKGVRPRRLVRRRSAGVAWGVGIDVRRGSEATVLLGKVGTVEQGRSDGVTEGRREGRCAAWGVRDGGIKG